MAKPCIFCEREGKLSKEHLWPNWLGKMYVRAGDEKYSFGSKTYLDKELQRDGVHEKPGHLFSLKNRVVCQECNNGWMSEVEEEVKPIILKLIGGKKLKVSDLELKALSFWLAMKVVTAEFAEKKESLEVTPQRERKAMMEHKKMPSYFNIFIGVHSTGHNSSWLRHSWTSAYSKDGPTPPLEGRRRNAQAISFMIGPVFFYVLNVRLLGFLPEKYFKFGKLKKIFPSKTHFVRWPQKALSRTETNIIAFMAQDFTESEIVKHIREMPDGENQQKA